MMDLGSSTSTNLPMGQVLQKIVNVMGLDRGAQLYRETLAAIGLHDLVSPDDNARFGEELISRGGMLSSIGRSIKIQAILQGARVGR
jgi:hypothetical protein